MGSVTIFSPSKAWLHIIPVPWSYVLPCDLFWLMNVDGRNFYHFGAGAAWAKTQLTHILFPFLGKYRSLDMEWVLMTVFWTIHPAPLSLSICVEQQHQRTLLLPLFFQVRLPQLFSELLSSTSWIILVFLLWDYICHLLA